MTNNSKRSLGWIITNSCTSKKAIRTDSQKGIGEILNTKLATIVEVEEEPEIFYEGNNNIHSTTRNDDINSNKFSANLSSMKLWFKGKKAKELARSAKMQFKRSKIQVVSHHHFCVKGSYINFLAAFVAKGSFIGLPRY